MVSVSHKGEWTATEKWLSKIPGIGWRAVLDKYGKAGVEALRAATPIDTGLTSKSWTYDIYKTRSGYAINWRNTNINNGVNIAIILQYGHGTKSGGYVQGVDYINPALRPILEELAEKASKEVMQ